MLPPRVSIVVPCFNKRELTAKCLDALVAHTPDEPVRWEAIFIDNASTDGTAGWLSSLGDPRLRVVRNTANLGFAVACNQGASVSRGRYVLFLNNDTEAHAGWLGALVSTLERDDSAGVAGSKLLYPDGSVQHAGMVVKRANPGELLRWDHLYRGCRADAAVVNREREFQAVTGAALLMRRARFEALGGFDEEYVNGWEDVDLCLRVRAAGLRVLYQPKSVLTHHESQTPGRFDRERPNAERFLAKWGGKLCSDEVEKLREDGEEELASLAEEMAALRDQLCRFVAVPDLFPGGLQPGLRTEPDGWRGRLSRYFGVRTAEKEQFIHLFQCLELVGRVLFRLPLDREYAR